MSDRLPWKKRVKTRFKALFNHQLDTPKELRRSLWYAKWVDVGFLRKRWTNDGEITQGVLRANNPTAARYAAYAEQGVRTVLNLRNDTHLAPFKLAARDTASAGLDMVSFPMAPRRAPTREELLALIELIPQLQKPVLIHCKSGADRTGLVAAIWLLTQEGADLDTARDQLSLRYLHRRESETGVLDAVLDLYADAATGQGFTDWVRDSYDPAQAKALFLEAKPKRGVWAETKAIFADLYRYAQYREARWHASFAGPVTTPDQEKRANFYMKWIDHGVLRGFWTNRAAIARDVYRSNHPTKARFEKEAQNGLRSVINLRGASQEPQYAVEQDLCKKLGLTLIDVKMSATRAPQPETLIQLFAAFDQAERPVLMHCKSGADRTGLAAALYLLDQGHPVSEARKQLSPRFLHFRSGRKGILDAVLDAYEADQKAGPMPLRDWVAGKYDPAKIKRV